MFRRIFLFLVATLFACGQVVAADPLQPARDALARGNWQRALAVMPRLDPVRNSATAFLLRSRIYVAQSDWYLARRDYNAALSGADAALNDALVARNLWQRVIVHRRRAVIFEARRAPNDLTAARNERLAANTLLAIIRGQ